MVFADEGRHEVQLDAANMEAESVTGPKTAHDYLRLMQETDEFDKRFEELFEKARDTTKMTRDEVHRIRGHLLADRQAAIESFVREHPSSPVAAWIAQRTYGFDPNQLAKIEEIYALLSPSLSSTSYMLALKQILDAQRALAVGSVAPNFTQDDRGGRPVSLSDFRGNYVLLDFWASWCEPCRTDNPNIVKAYKLFKNKGFTVLGVSLDDNRERWLKAIEDGGLTWTNVSDLQGWKNVVAGTYGVNAVPTNFLIGPDGRVIAKNLKGVDLQEKLAALLK